LPRHARMSSKTQIYHVMVRGNERKNIFIDDEDKYRFLDTIKEKKKDDCFKLYAYCIMDNHVHLVIQEGNDSISRIMKRLGTSYAYYFNKKYKRIGHVFQDRYKSEAIEDETYLCSVIKYVHQNPEKAGINTIRDYKWSSYKSYTQFRENNLSLLDIKEILDLFSNDVKRAIKQFIEYTQERDNANFLDAEDEPTETQEENVGEYISAYLKEKGLQIGDLARREHVSLRNELLYELIQKFSLSKRKIAEITGVNREVVRKTMLSKEPSR
jgi:putative transposase